MAMEIDDRLIGAIFKIEPLGCPAFKKEILINELFHLAGVGEVVPHEFKNST